MTLAPNPSTLCNTMLFAPALLEEYKASPANVDSCIALAPKDVILRPTPLVLYITCPKEPLFSISIMAPTPEVWLLINFKPARIPAPVLTAFLIPVQSWSVVVSNAPALDTVSITNDAFAICSDRIPITGVGVVGIPSSPGETKSAFDGSRST